MLIVSGTLLYWIVRGIPHQQLPLRGYWPPLRRIEPRWVFWANAILGLLISGVALAAALYACLLAVGLVEPVT
jgi:hypothetical protein